MKTGKVNLSQEEQEAINEFCLSKNLPLDLAVTFNDVSLPEDFSLIRSRKDINDFSTHLTDQLQLGIPFISANMESVTGLDMIVAMEREGGLGILPQELPIDERVAILEKVKRTDCALIEQPLTITANSSLQAAKKLMKDFNIYSLIIIDEKKKPIGVLSTRDWLYEVDDQKIVAKLMKKRKLITAPKDISFEEAAKILRQHRIEKLPLIDDRGKLAGLITAHGLFYKKHYSRALRDKNGQFIRIGTIGVGRRFNDKIFSEVEKQAEAGIIGLLINTARAYSINTQEVVQEVKKRFPDLFLIVGNVSTPEGAKFLFEIGADVVKVGQGPGLVCSTREVGVGVPQLTAIAQCGVIARRYGKTIIGDGGIKNSGDVAKALIAGAQAIMSGRLFAGTNEAASLSYLYYSEEFKTDLMVKDYFGQASFEAQSRRIKRGELDYIRRPEGVKKIIPVIGPLSFWINDLLNGLRSTMSYLGVNSISKLYQDGCFVFQTKAGHYEGIKKEL